MLWFAFISIILAAIAIYYARISRKRERDIAAVNASMVAEVEERKNAQEKFRALVEASPYSVLLVNMEGRIILSNAEATRKLGYSANEFYEMLVEELVPPEVRGHHHQLRTSYNKSPIARPMGVGAALRAMRKDGTTFPAKIDLSPIVTSEGPSVLCSIADITERVETEKLLRELNDVLEKRVQERTAELETAAAELRGEILQRQRAEEKIRANEERYMRSVRSLQAGIWEWDITGNSYFISELGRFIFDLPQDAPLSQSFDLTSDLHPDDQQNVRAAIEYHLRDKVPFDVEFRRHLSSGNYRYLRCTGQAIWDNAGTPLRMHGTIQDVSPRRQSEEKLKRYAEELERSNNELKLFATVASHDLQEPLRAVAGCVQLLQQQFHGKLDERADQFIDLAVDGATRMQTMINDLLAFSRVRKTEKPLEITNAEISLKTALKNLAATIAETGAVITHDPLPSVPADSGLLPTLFQNLIANGIKFRKPDTIPRIHIGAAIHNERALFSVKDNGIGISPEFHERIFGIFQRLHSRQEYPGTGIGLAICKKIVEQHGGQLWVESSLDHGAIFYFDFLLHPAIKETVNDATLP